MTNGNKVRAMTDEELAKFILDSMARVCAKLTKKNETSIRENFVKDGVYSEFVLWLREEAEE